MNQSGQQRRSFAGSALRLIILSPLLPLAGVSSSGCVSVTRLIYRPKVKESRLLVPASHLARLKDNRTVILIRARGLKEPIMLRRVDGTLLALSGLCTHQACSIDPTPYDYECPCHGSSFALDGRVLKGPAERRLKQFSIRPTDDGISIAIN